VVVEIKGENTVCDGREKPVWRILHYAPEDVTAGQPPARIEALKRRFQIVEIRWRRLERARLVNWRIESHGAFQAPKKCWWSTEE
jgi:hypothetical protein